MKGSIFSISLFACTTAYTQNVGIGTVTPERKLHVVSAADEAIRMDAPNPYLSLYSNGIYKGYVWKSPNSVELGSAAGTNLAVTLAPDGIQTLFAGANGRIGIGTIAPSHKFHVEGFSFLNGFVGIENNNPGSPLSFSSTSGKKISLLRNGAADMGFSTLPGLLQIHADIATSDIAIGIDASGSFSEKMRIKGNGKVGINTSDPQAQFHVKDSSVLFGASDLISAPPGPAPASGVGRRMMWYIDKAAFRAGGALNDEWDSYNIGNYSVAMGAYTKASEFTAVAMGYLSKAVAPTSFAIGYDNYASGANSAAFGNTTDASGENSSAFGLRTLAYGYSGTVVGMWNRSVTGFPQAEVEDGTPLFIVGNGSNILNRSNALVVLKNGNVGLQDNNAPNAPLAFSNSTGQKICLFESAPNAQHGFAVAPGALRIHSDAAAAVISFGYYNGGVYTEKMYLNNSTGVLNVNGTNYASDIRLKRSIYPLQNSLARLMQLKGYHYYWNNEITNENLQTGVIAQEVRKWFPHLVTERNDGVLSVNYIGLIPVLIESVKEQQKQLAEQQNQINELRSMILELKSR